MTSIAEDFRILRNQVSKELYSDQELKNLFLENNYDLVKCLLLVEEKISGLKDYRSGEIVKLSETQERLKELREIANSKDSILNNVKSRLTID